MNSKVIASCYVSQGGQKSHQRIRKGRDGHGLETPTDGKKKVTLLFSMQREFKSNHGFQSHIEEIACFVFILK